MVDNNKVIRDIISVANSISRKTELEQHHKTINYQNVARNRKKYTRKIKHKNSTKNVEFFY